MIKRLLLVMFAIFLITACKKDPAAMPPAKPTTAIVLKDSFVLSVSISNTAPHGVFTITTNDTAQETIQLYDRWGRQELNQVINGTTTIDIVGLQPGVYFYMLTTRTKTFKGHITFTN